MALLRIRKPNGEIVEIAALPGAKGDAPPPATNGTIGTIKIPEDYRTSGLQISDRDGCLRVVPATEEQIDQRIFGYLPITPKNLDYAVKSVGDGYYALASDVGDIETALDSIVAMQNALIGGDGV